MTRSLFCYIWHFMTSKGSSVNVAQSPEITPEKKLNTGFEREVSIRLIAEFTENSLSY